MKALRRLAYVIRRFRQLDPPPGVEPSEVQRREITEAIRKQKFRGDLAGRQEY